MESLLLTGASGFLGQNILPYLREVFSPVVTLGRSDSNDVRADLSMDLPALNSGFDVVVHAAGLAHVTAHASRREAEFFKTNVEGTVNLCRALEKTGLPKSFIFISSVSVYGLEQGKMIDETYPLAGKTNYALSKIEAEKFLTDWCAQNDIVLTILRPALIAGKKAPGNLGAMIEGIKKGRYFDIAGGKALKSIVLARDIAAFIPLVKDIGGIYNLCAEPVSFGDLSKAIASQLNVRRPISIPYSVAKTAAFIGDVLGGRFPISGPKLRKITDTLTFSNKKACSVEGWKPSDVLENLNE